MTRLAAAKAKLQGKWLIGLGSLTFAWGGWWLVRQIHHLNQRLYEALPVNVMTGGNKSVYIYLPDDMSDVVDEPSKWRRFMPFWDGFVWKPVTDRTPWELVTLARSEDTKYRKVGLKLLASIQNLHVAFCRQIAQASDKRMAVALARSKTADLRMLLPPPPLPSVIAEKDFEHNVKTLLSLLPQDDAHKFVKYLTSLALQERQPYLNDEETEFWRGDHSLKPRLRKKSQNVLGTLFLEALLSHSTIKEHCAEIIKHMGLPILMQLYKTLPHDLSHLGVVAKIIGNLALQKDHHDKIYQAGWVTVLAEWYKSSDLEVSLSAARALVNLDQENYKWTFGNGVYLAHPLHWDSETRILGDVVFIHGLKGGAFKTWRQRDLDATEETFSSQTSKAFSPQCKGDKNNNGLPYTSCWPKDWLAHDCPHLRIILVDYDTHVTEWGRTYPGDDKERSLEVRSSEFLQKLRKAGVGNRPIVWVSHSMGGLIVKEMLLQSKATPDPDLRKVYENTKGAAFYSVPHHGSSLATFSSASQYLLLPSREVRELHIGNEKLVQLHKDFVDLARNRELPCISFCEMRKTRVENIGIMATFVSLKSADMGIGEFHPIDTDHKYICKPSSRTSFTYSHLAEFVHKCIDHSVLDDLQHPLDIQFRGSRDLKFVIGTSFT